MRPTTLSKTPPTILNGGTAFHVSTNDWLDALEWIKNNTPKDAVVASWWDYGYWIQTLGERATLQIILHSYTYYSKYCKNVP